ncbi:hypothetical protein [Agrococcus sp. Marseille-P2731]|uniref:hypothetical protein n=1 Tax=Agrococcus sp. Marseille-P2731 TaxID=1841862 RepID=UPI00093086A0|nr:hypothetical protein [Agrococcus sp. Marseille-P2731]
MLGMLATIGRVLVQHWPALLAWHLGGVLSRYVLIEIAGWVGAFSAVAGFLILPLAVLARLASFVGMFLVVRSSLRELSAIAPPPTTPEARRKTFVASLLGGVLPFFAVYMATGNVQEDADAYATRALEVQSSLSWGAFVTGEEFDSTGTVNEVLLSPAVLIALGIAFAGRLAWGRWEQRLPRWVSVIAVYLEGVWVFLFVLLIGEYLPLVTAWVDDRQAMAWVADARGWLAASVAPIAWLWDGIDWALGHLGSALGQPLAWLTIGGVMYGQAVRAQAPPIPAQLGDPRLAPVHERIEQARRRYGALPTWAQSQAKQAWGSVSGRFMPIWRAILLMLRGGPLLFGTAVLLYAVVEWLEGGLMLLTTRIVGPQGFNEFWMVWDSLLFLPTAMLVETLRIALIAGAYDAMIGRLRRHEAGAAPAGAATTTTDASAREAIAGPAAPQAARPTAAQGSSTTNVGSTGSEPRIATSSSNGPASSGTR